MEKIYKQLKKLKKTLEKEIIERELYFYSKSPKWQDSENGIDYLDMTEKLIDMEESVEELKEDIWVEI